MIKCTSCGEEFNDNEISFVEGEYKICMFCYENDLNNSSIYN